MEALLTFTARRIATAAIKAGLIAFATHAGERLARRYVNLSPKPKPKPKPKRSTKPKRN